MLTILLFWVIIGLVAGFLASALIRGRSYGCVGDIIIGVVGSVIGGFLARILGFNTTGSILYTALIAFLGACILVAILHLVSGEIPA